MNFPHDWTGRICDITTDPEVANAYEELTGIDGNPFKLYNYEKCGKDEYIRVFPETYSFVAGIWELKLIGQEKLDLEFLLKQEKKLPAVEVFNLSGFYVQKADVVIERQSIIDDDVTYIEIEATEKINKFDKFFQPCAGIDEIDGAFFVIQTEHLSEFLISLKDEQEPNYLSLNNSLYLLGEVLNAVKSKNRQWTQSAIIDEILTKRQGNSVTGLEERTIQEYFSTANKRLKAK